jgi:hypothetical protein
VVWPGVDSVSPAILYALISSLRAVPRTLVLRKDVLERLEADQIDPTHRYAVIFYRVYSEVFVSSLMRWVSDIPPPSMFSLARDSRNLGCITVIRGLGQMYLS